MQSHISESWKLGRLYVEMAPTCPWYLHVGKPYKIACLIVIMVDFKLYAKVQGLLQPVLRKFVQQNIVRNTHRLQPFYESIRQNF